MKVRSNFYFWQGVRKATRAFVLWGLVVHAFWAFSVVLWGLEWDPVAYGMCQVLNLAFQSLLAWIVYRNSVADLDRARGDLDRFLAKYPLTRASREDLLSLYDRITETGSNPELAKDWVRNAFLVSKDCYGFPWELPVVEPRSVQIHTLH